MAKLFLKIIDLYLDSIQAAICFQRRCCATLDNRIYRISAKFQRRNETILACKKVLDSRIFSPDTLAELSLTLRFSRVRSTWLIAEHKVLISLLKLLRYSNKIIDLLLQFSKVLIKYARKRRSKSAPGTSFLRLAETLYSEKTYKETFVQLVGDWQESYYEAIKNGDRWQAYLVNICEAYNFFKAVALRSPIGDGIEKIKKLVK